MSKRLPTVWDADAHTIAKIAILKGYLNAWFRILAISRPGQTILYVDGFAGPGFYKNHPEGSPLAALKTADGTIHSLGQKFTAARLHCAFIEVDPERYTCLVETVSPYRSNPRIGITTINAAFADGIERVREVAPGPFRGEGPLLIFADPFGGTGIPFQAFARCMQGETAELLINLDADGIGRIFSADNNNRESQLTELFGDDSWRSAVNAWGDLKKLSVQILDLYKRRLRTISGVRFIWSFAMRGSKDTISYHLVFATKHPLGMEKMKEAMRAIDESRTYSFSDAHVDQQPLFGNDNTEAYAEALFKEYAGKTISMTVANEFALNETPFVNAKAMLSMLEAKGRLKVQLHPNESRKAGSFPEIKVKAVEFGRFDTSGEQAEFEI